jgi:diguanylate cyclase (GGDEF)-like protein
METNKALLDTLMMTTGEAILVIDADRRIVKASKAFEATTGLRLPAQREARGEHLDHMDGFAALSGAVGEVCASGETRKGELRGHAHAWEYHIEPVRENGRVACCISILRPPAAAPHPGASDPEHGVSSRALFYDRIGQAVSQAQRAGKAVLVMLVSIDRFREIGDVLGEAASARLREEIAERLRQCARTSDTVVRLDSERFAFIMQIAAPHDSVLLPEKIMAAFDRTFELSTGRDVAITCSVGASVYPDDASTADELVQNASVALHHAETSGRNGYRFFSGEMNARARRRLEIESGIRRALANGELRVHYQPKINVSTRAVAGLEALVRWQDPERGMVSPLDFIPIAEESGLIEQIGHWVLEETCAQMRRWQEQGLPPARASVNVSARQFRNHNFVPLVKDVLARTGLAPEWLELEITESMLMGDIAAIVARMQALRETGVSLSIDDFGTGYSSLAYLSRFPITTLKIDRAFIADVQHNPQTAEIARAIIGMSRGLNLEVVAEGAEVKEQVDFLHEHGCHLVQGYYYSRPLPADDFARLLRNGLVDP